MGKRLVGFGHAVSIVPFLDGPAAIIRCIKQFRGKFLHHGLFTPITRITDDPSETQGGLTIPINFHRHLVVCSAYAARFHFQSRLNVINRLLEDLQRLDAKAMRELLREVPTERLTLALKGASEGVTQAIFRGLSSRAADLIRDDLELLGSVRRAEIEKARVEVVQVALRLEADGRIDLGREDT